MYTRFAATTAPSVTSEGGTFIDLSDAFDAETATTYAGDAVHYNRLGEQRLADALECGVVWGNSAMLMDPALAFGGIKESGLGVASGREAIDTMTRLKRVSVRFEADAPIPAWSDI